MQPQPNFSIKVGSPSPIFFFDSARAFVKKGKTPKNFQLIQSVLVAKFDTITKFDKKQNAAGITKQNGQSAADKI